MEFTALELSVFLNGTIEGDPSVKVFKPAKIEEAQQGDICFLGNNKYLPYAYTTNASVMIVNADVVFEKPVKPVLIRVKDAYSAIALLLEKYQKLKTSDVGKIEEQVFISSSAKIGEQLSASAFTYISEGAVIGDHVLLHAHVFIGKNVRIGNHVILFPGVIILDDCIIGDHCIINANAVIGSEGFGFAPTEEGNYKKIAQTGNVIIEDDVEIGSNTTIDRATMGSTIIRRGVKIDNLVQIAHNVEIGENTVIAAQSGIAGSTKIGKNCILGGQVGVVGHLTIADGTKINAQSGVNKTVKETNQSLTGSPAFDFASSMKSQVLYRKLPELMKRITDLENTIAEMQKNSF